VATQRLDTSRILLGCEPLCLTWDSGKLARPVFRTDDNVVYGLPLHLVMRFGGRISKGAIGYFDIPNPAKFFIAVVASNYKLPDSEIRALLSKDLDAVFGAQQLLGNNLTALYEFVRTC